MSKRGGFSLLELLVALIASTVLVAALGATVVITTSLLEVPPDHQAVWHDRAIDDRVASDLRYATSIEVTGARQFQIVKPDRSGGGSQTIVYESSDSGLTRQVNGGAIVSYDTDSPAQLFQVESQPATASTSGVVRVFAVSTANTTSNSASLDIELPEGCTTDDFLLLCLATKSPTSVTVAPIGWRELTNQKKSRLTSVVLYRTYDPSLEDTISVSVSPDAEIAATLVALENVDLANPIAWSGVATHTVAVSSPNTYPEPLETSGFSAGQLNVQVFAADGQPWTRDTLGIPGFTDLPVAQTDSSSDQCSVGVAVRTGATPTLANTPTLWQQQNGKVVQTGIRLEVKQ
ncbi:MAG: prepilin-type N-terminal cleavage/methylation domain-containing protein [Pirellulales bacterium]|nr:prepilin-type N-terminal cleavage/methylation domain-containing protein [Pirellulales bacterium]